jgi:hypothetical protein
MTEDVIAALERDTDALLKQARPADYARMIAARIEHAGEPGFAPPPEPTAPKAAHIAHEYVLRVHEPLSDRQIEAMSGALIAEVFDRAKRTLALADAYSRTGQRVELYAVTSAQAARLIGGYAALVEALARFRNGGAQKIIVERIERVVVTEQREKRGERRGGK